MKPFKVISIRRTFRNILVASPFLVGSAGCPTGLSGGCPTRTQVFPVGLSPDAGLLPDGGAHTCQAECASQFFISVDSCSFIRGDAGEDLVSCSGVPACPGGRRPHGLLTDGATDCVSSVGAYFARLAHMEAASVHSFARLRRELRAHGAPLSLSDAARRAAADEVRHAKVTAGLAERFGATVQRPRIAHTAVRPLVAVAMENAAEGCVAETYAALGAHWQAAHACDAEVRAVMTEIAEDETRHAELAWEVHAWMTKQLDEKSLETVTAAALEAAHTLRAQTATAVSNDVIAVAGVPSPSVANALWNGLAQELWAA